MGLYIQTGANRGKAAFLVQNYNTIVVSRLEWRTTDPLIFGLVVVVDNGPFEAAAWAPDVSERDYFAKPHEEDKRPMTFLIMDRDVVSKLAR